MLNEVRFIGYIVNNKLEIQTSSNNGTRYLKFIVSIPVYTPLGKAKRNSKMVYCVAFGKYADSLINKVYKDQCIMFFGHLDNSNYYDKDNVLQKGMYIYIDRYYGLNKLSSVVEVDKNGNITDDNNLVADDIEIVTQEGIVVNGKE